MSLSHQLNRLGSRALQVYESKNLAIVPYENTGFKLDRVETHPELRCLEFVFLNQPLLPIYESLNQMYQILQSSERYQTFGTKKIVITSIGGLVESYDTSNELVVINLHSNVILDNDTSFNRYYQKIRKDIKSTYHQLYGFEIPRYFYVRVWNADHLQNKTVYSNAKMTQFRNNINSLRTLLNRSYSTKCYDSLTNITPLKKLSVNPKPFYTMDIETISKEDNNQKPFIISFSSVLDSDVFYNKDLNLLWQDFFTFIFSKLTNNVNTIFVHNLGGFDGIFLHKYICNTFPD